MKAQRPIPGKFTRLLALAIGSLFVSLMPFRLAGQHFQAEETKGLPLPAETHLPTSPVKFVQNQGQWPPNIRFMADLPGGRVFLEGNRLAYTFADVTDLHDRFFQRKVDRNTPLLVNSHGLHLEFEGALPSPRTHGEKQRPEKHNYFLGNEPDKWAGDVPTFDQVLYEDLYAGIDMRLYGGATTLKYDLICEPGSSPASISLRYKGADDIRIQEGKLVVKTSVNEMTELAPVAYQESPNGRIPVPCRFVLRGDRVSFEFPEGYYKDIPLVIDPTVVFSSFTGSTADNFGFTATYDDNGFLYAGGIVFGVGYPFTVGAFQTSFGGGGVGGTWTMNGGVDMSITKYDPAAGTQVYSTYVGGSGNDQPHSLVCNAQGQLYIYGVTWSTNFPVTAGAFDNTNNGGGDIVITALTAGGNGLVGSTYFGGSGEDGVNISSAFGASSLKHNYGDDSRGEITIDGDGEVYVASCSRSGNFPVSPGCYQAVISSAQDGVAFKLNAALTNRIWCTYIGGTGDDACYGLAIDATENVYVTGGTASSNFPVTGGAWIGSYQGGIDGFVSRLRNDGQALLRSTFAGTSSYDQSFFVQLDRNYDVYIYGQTTGNYLLTGGVYGQAGGGQFITKLNANLTTVAFSTRFGTGGNAINISPTAFLVDVCSYIYVAGWGGATNYQGTTTGMPVTANAFDGTTDGSDVYVMVLRQNASALDYATFMGGTAAEHVDGGTSRFNKFAEVYHAVCAGCGGSDSFPAVNPYSATNNSFNCNLACFKIEFPLAGIIAAFQPNPSTPGCVPHTVYFDNNSSGGTSFIWDFDDGSPIVTTYNATHTFTQPGNYTVMLIANDPASCNLSDTAYVVITVLPQPNVTINPDTTICSGDAITLTVNGASTYNWIAGTVSNPTGSSNTVSPTVTTTYTVAGSNGALCHDTVSVTITVIPSPTANAGPNQTICPGDTAQLNGTGAGTVSWTPAAFLSNPNIANPLAFPPTTTTYTFTVTAANGCDASDNVVVTVAAVTANAGPDQVLCAGDAVQLNASGGTIYNWSPAGSLSNPNIANPVATPGGTTTYTVTVTNAFNCFDTDQITVTVNPLPNVSAFSDATICQRDTVQLFSNGASTYLWSPGTTLSNSSAQNPFAFPMSTTIYVVTGTDANNCSNTDSVVITVLQVPTADAGADATICQDSLIQLNGTGGGTYLWSPALGLSNPVISNPVASPPATQLYVLEVTAPNGCKDLDSVIISITPTPIVDMVDSILLCYGQGARIIATGGTHYLWNTGDTTHSIQVQPASNTWYSVITWVDGCPSKPDTVWVTVDQNLPIADFSMNPDTGFVPLDVDFTNLSQNAHYYQWLFGNYGSSTEENPSFTFNDDGTIGIWLIAFNDNGCSDTAYKLIVAQDWVLWIPNVFSPNGDGLNDFFITPWLGIAEYHIMIFDRWGMLIFESYDPDFRWNGYLHSEECQEGVYTWVIDGVSIKGNQFKKAGTVTLIR